MQLLLYYDIDDGQTHALLYIIYVLSAHLQPLSTNTSDGWMHYIHLLLLLHIQYKDISHTTHVLSYQLYPTPHPHIPPITDRLPAHTHALPLSTRPKLYTHYSHVLLYPHILQLLTSHANAQLPPDSTYGCTHARHTYGRPHDWQLASLQYQVLIHVPLIGSHPYTQYPQLLSDRQYTQLNMDVQLGTSETLLYCMHTRYELRQYP